MTAQDPVAATVVVIDPDPTVSRELEAALESEGREHHVHAVPDPSELSEGWVEQTDCVVCELDIGAPDSTADTEGQATAEGLSLLSRVRAEAGDLPFILYTGSDDGRTLSQAVALDVTEYLPKAESSVEELAGRIESAIATARERRRRERTQQVNDVFRRVAMALVRADTRQEIEQTVCDILAESEPYRFTWIGEYVPEHNRLLPRADAGLEDGFLDEIPVGEDSTLPEKGPGPRSLATGEVQVAQDVGEEPAFEPYREEVDSRGYRSVATVPLAHGSELYGLLAVYAAEPDAFDAAEQTLLESLGEDIAHAIHAVSLKSELRRFQEAFEYGAHGMCITDPSGIIEHVNLAFAEQLGRSVEEMVGKRLSKIQPVGPEDIFDRPAEFASDGSWKREILGSRRDGTAYVAEQTIAPIDGTDGDLAGFVVIQTDVTDRRERETEIRRERDLLDSLFETSPIGIVVLTPEGDIKRANKRAEEILGLSESAITERTYDEPTWMFTDESGDPIPHTDHPFVQALEYETEIYDLELRMEREHADPIWVSINGAPLYDPDGDLERIVFTFDDVTQTKHTQRQLEETNRTLDTLFQAAPVGIIAQDLDETITHWNDGAEEIFGWTADEVVGTSTPPFVTGEATAEYRELFERTAAGESFTGVEIQRERKDGSPVDLHLSAAPIHGADGYVTGIMAVFADLSALKTRERQLRQFREAVEHTGHSVMITDTEGVIQYVNPAFEEQTGYGAEEAIGRTPAILQSGEHDSAFFEELWETILAGEVWEHEIQNRQKDGTLMHVDQTIAPVFGEDDEIEYFVTVNHDITDRLEKEQELERQNQRLAEFASVVSHDLRNPLNVAEGNLDLLDAEGDHAANIQGALDRMGEIIDDVLTLAREGETADSLEPIDVATVAQESWAAVDGDPASLTVDGDPTIRGDEGRTRRIFENLCRNAMEHVGPEVEVRVGQLDGSGIFLEDDGPGIDPDHRESVMESGYTTAESGNGLGLAIVRRLAEAQGWTVTLTEGETGGARFEFVPDPESVPTEHDE